MTTEDPSVPLQAGLYALLTADAPLMALVSGVYDEPPEGKPPAYVVIGSRKQTTPDDAHGRNGRQNIVHLDTWTRARSTLPGDQIGARLVALLDKRQADLDPLVAGHTVWKLRWEDSMSLDDPDRELRHRVDRFRIHTAQPPEE
jgi:hypothetical protein